MQQSGVQQMFPSKYSPPVQQNLSVMYMAVGVVLALVGVILGKYVLWAVNRQSFRDYAVALHAPNHNIVYLLQSLFYCIYCQV